MGALKRHWTERSVEDYLARIGSDFVRHVEQTLEDRGSGQAALARDLGVSAGRVSQVLNSPGNLTLLQVIRYARALGHKVAIVAYDDRDPGNERGPIAPEVFVTCWERAGQPTDFFDLADVDERTAGTEGHEDIQGDVEGIADNSQLGRATPGFVRLQAEL